MMRCVNARLARLRGVATPGVEKHFHFHRLRSYTLPIIEVVGEPCFPSLSSCSLLGGFEVEAPPGIFHIASSANRKINKINSKMEQNETGCQAPQAPILCVNNCGFFGTASTMNMCSKCYKDLALKQEQADFAASSIQNIVNGSSTTTAEKDIAIEKPKAIFPEVITSSTKTSLALSSIEEKPEEVKEGPKRCGTCRKRVGLTGFNCRCGSIFCSVHRYSDKHECSFDYRSAGQEAIAKANPVVKAEKLDKI